MQRNAEVNIWGWGKALEPIIITSSWSKDTLINSKINHSGRWEFKIKTNEAKGKHSLTIKGYNTIVLNNIMLGEVWLCSGQSNMEWTAAAGIDNAEEEVKNANYPDIRFFTVNPQTSEFPQENCNGQWLECNPGVMLYSSAVGYFFAREIHQELNVPVGIIVSGWGGTPAEAWTTSQSIFDDRVLAHSYSKLIQEPWGPKEPGSIFNGMINPLIPYTIKGALWYQGEANVRNASTYEPLLSTLITTWRKKWGYDFPFYISQIAPYQYGDDNNDGAIVRDQQRKVLTSTDKTAIVVTSDIGNIDDIHPRNKQDVGKRLANIALKYDYQKINGIVESPLVSKTSLKENELILHFTQSQNGLVAKGDIDFFEVASADKVFKKVKPKVVGSTIVLDISKIAKPKYVRFAMGNTSTPYLFNAEGLPVSCFEEEIK